MPEGGGNSLPLTESRDLRTGDPPWDDDTWLLPPQDDLPASPRDVAIVGAGISGAIIAERLTADGHSVVLLDRRPPGLGSTAASTAQIMWAMDVPLRELAARIGEAEAARRWQRVYRSVQDLRTRLDGLAIDDGLQDCPTVYLEGALLDARDLADEAAHHDRAGLPSSFLDAAAVAARFGIAPRAAIVSDGGYAINPVKTAHGMLLTSQARGAHLRYPANVIALSEADEEVTLALEDGRTLRASNVILASGYERARLFLPPEFSLLSTYVVATAPGTAPLWREDAMIWEAADPYLYLRADAEGRVIVGGEDVDISEQSTRDALIQVKAGTIAAKLGKLLGGREIAVDRCWAATFGSSPDGLPAIGLAANMSRTWLAAGFGGNGIAFTALAADLLANALSGIADPDAAAFDPYRFR